MVGIQFLVLVGVLNNPQEGFLFVGKSNYWVPALGFVSDGM